VWRVVVWSRRGPDGRRRRLTATVRGGVRAARARERELLEARDRAAVPDARTTLADYLSAWLTVRRAELAPQTWARYESLLRVHVVPHIGALRLRELQPWHLRELYRELAERLSPRTVGHVHRALHAALAQATLDGMLATNPADRVRPPRVEEHGATALDEAAAIRLLADLEGTPVYLPAWLALATGLREGEVLALQWHDVDLDRGTVTVTHSLEQVGRSVRRKETKTPRGRRTVVLPAELAQALRRHRGELAALRRRYANLWVDHGYVFPSTSLRGGPAGRPWTPHAFKAAWRKATRARGWRIRFHDLRHTHATLLMRAGLPPREVAEQLGHADTGLVNDLYGHVLPDRRAIVAEVVGRVLRRA
jgi:integrase